MRHLDYFQELEKSKEYRTAEDKLRINFALGKAVVRARIKKGWSQAKLAKRAGTKQANISHIEAGLANPTLKLIQKLMKALDIEIQFCEFDDTRQSLVSVQTKDIQSIAAPNWPIRSNWKQEANSSINRKLD